MQSTVWVFSNEPKSTKIVRERNKSKQIVACFFQKTEHVLTIPLQQRKMANSEWYTAICLPDIFKKISKTSRRNWITYHHENASSHTSTKTNFIFEYSKHRFDETSTVLAWLGTEWLLFPYVKNKLRVERFSTPEEVVDTFRTKVLLLCPLKIISRKALNVFQNFTKSISVWFFLAAHL